MASFAPIRGTRSQIETTPIVDGQFLIETDSEQVGSKERIYLDVNNSSRIIVGGGGADRITALMDVDATDLGNNSVLKYNSSSSKFVCGDYLDEWSATSQVQTSGNNLIVVFDNLNNNYAYDLYYEGGLVGIISAIEETGTQANTKKITYTLDAHATAGTNCKLRIIK